MRENIFVRILIVIFRILNLRKFIYGSGDMIVFFNLEGL